MSEILFARIEEVHRLLAFLDPTFPFAHLAPRHAAIAIRDLETELVRMDDGFNDPLEPVFETPPSLILLRKIATTAATTAATCSKDITFAIKHNDVAFIALLIEAKIGVNSNGILRYASELGQTDIVRLILAEFKLKIKEITVRKSLRIASKMGYTEIVCLLLLKLPHEFTCDNAFTAACANGCTDIARIFLERGVRNASDGLEMASQRGHFEIVRMILDRRVDAEALQMAFQMACTYGRTNIVNELISCCDPTANNFYALKYASENGHIDVVRKLLSVMRVPGNVLREFSARARKRGHFEINALLLANSE